MRESELLRHIAARSGELSRHFPRVLVGPGDDCAVLAGDGGQLLLTVDHVVEGKHVERLEAEPSKRALDLIARKAIARSISDIAAMGGEPVASLATACLPPGFGQSVADELFDRMHSWANHWKSPLIGGDIASTAAALPGPLVLTVTVIGRAHAGHGPALRAHARVGDAVYVTGKLGGSLASGRHLTFEPRLREAGFLCDFSAARAGESASGAAETGRRALGAMIDLSDGLGRDAGRVAAASGVRIEIDARTLPRHAGVESWRAAMGDGEDYELMFTFDGVAGLPGECPRTGVAFTRIGEVRAGAGCVVRTAEGEVEAGELGFDHG
jgi:thiamine-monophosphate kinase